jgi:ribosome maturation factor RimP
MVLEVKSARGLHQAQRIIRINANDLTLQVAKGHASEEVMIPFSEIQEVQLKHKDA